jgi:NTP pyrophosphatase (non-canonical NTP hydrolase)
MKKYKKLQELVDRIGHVAQDRNWDKSCFSGGCYIHLEVSEFIEALRGKGDSTPEEEAGDILVALFAVLDWYKIPIAEVLNNAKKAIKTLEEDPDVGRHGSN